VNINVPRWARSHFWEEPPPGHHEFWAFSRRPRCKEGDEIIFRFDGQPVAKAVVAKIEPPGLTEGMGKYRFRTRWKVFWDPDSFVDLRDQTKEGKCRTRPA
jgi:hypothetical protein